MARQLLIGVDIGTQGTKTALYRLDGRCLAEAFERSRLHRPSAGIVEEDPERQVGSVCRTIRKCLRDSRMDACNVAALAIDGQMAGVIGVGADGQAVTPYDSWLDTRCEPFIAEMTGKACDRIIQLTGGPPSFNHGPKILWWKNTRKKTYRRIAAFVQPGGYAAMRLCGLPAARAFIDTTYLHFSGFADNRRSRWDLDLCQQFAVDPAKLPRIVGPHEIVGELTSSMARRCGLRAGTPVVAGCGDTAASFLACGATRPGVCVDVAGTASVFATTTQRMICDRQHRMVSCGQSVVPGLWHPYAYINGGGMNLEWFAGQIAAGLGSRDRSLARLAREVHAIQPADDLPMFVPHLGGRVCPAQPQQRGAWANLNWSHGRAHLFRAMLEAVALEYGIYQRVICRLAKGFRFRELRVTGGGQRSDAWNQIKADVLGVPVVRIARSGGAPMGAAMIAGFGAGLLADLPTAAQAWVQTAQTVRSNRTLATYYTRRRRRYESLLQTMNEWSVANAANR
jgi:xylulokinase